MAPYQFKTSQLVYLFFKRFGDIFGASVGILVLSPILILCAIIIKCTSKGPVFFRQERLGKHKKVFKIFKFRSMRADAPEIPPSEMTPEQQKAMEYKWGNFMRKTSIDEIPQLFNILIGDMSFIGPRPGAAHNEEELVELRDSHTPSAFEVRPGLGGLAQSKLHRDHNPEEKARLDSVYVSKISLWLDIKLFFKTIFGVFSNNTGR